MQFLRDIEQQLAIAEQASTRKIKINVRRTIKCIIKTKVQSIDQIKRVNIAEDENDDDVSDDNSGIESLGSNNEWTKVNSPSAESNNLDDYIGLAMSLVQNSNRQVRSNLNICNFFVFTLDYASNY